MVVIIVADWSMVGIVFWVLIWIIVIINHHSSNDNNNNDVITVIISFLFIILKDITISEIFHQDTLFS